MSTEAPQAKSPTPPAVVRLGWAFARSTADFGWRLLQRRSPLALTAGPHGLSVRNRNSVALRSDGRDVAPTSAELARAYPHATGRLLVLVPDSAGDEGAWAAGSEEYGGTYASLASELLEWTAVHVRAASPSPEADRAVELATLLQRTVDHWPEPVERLVVVAHGDGGLAVRAAAGVRSEIPGDWTRHVTDVVLLGTPHLVAPAGGTLPVGRQLDEELAGIVTDDMVRPEVEPIPAARYVVITRSARLRRNPVGAMVGGLLWWRDRARLRRRSARHLFPTASIVHVEDPRAPLTNHPEVQRALLDWLV